MYNEQTIEAYQKLENAYEVEISKPTPNLVRVQQLAAQLDIINEFDD